MTPQIISQEDLQSILYANTSQPHSILGLHSFDKGSIIRVFDPAAVKIDVKIGKNCYPIPCIDQNGLYAITFKKQVAPDYSLIKTYADGSTVTSNDCYSFKPSVSEFDMNLFDANDLRDLTSLLGARIITVDNVSGSRFVLWAPNAKRVSVIGNFNNWDGRRNIMRCLGSCGLWEIFLPEIGAGEYYKYEIRDSNGHIFTKQDPISRQCELRPGTASIVCADSDFSWTDNKWMNQRRITDPLKSPLSIYEVHLSSWDGPGLPDKNGREFYNYRELAPALSDYIESMGFTHIELMPISEHPLDQSWGYQTTGYFAPTSRFGTPEDFAHFINHMHNKGIGVLIDWVPAHFPKDAFALGRFDGSALYEHLDPRLGEHQDWGTYIFNYGRHEVENFLIANALYWLKEFHIDGLRVDAVSSMIYLDYSREHDQWVPNQFGGNENLHAIDFIKRLNTLSHDLYPGSMIIAEESTAYPNVSRPIYDGGLGFTMKWNMGWMHDFLEYFGQECVHRKHHQGQITFALAYAFNENFILPLSHDEVVHGKGSLLTRMPGDIWQKFANLRCLFGTMFSHPGKKLLFMGSEIAQWREWDCDGSLDWPTLSNPLHRGIQKLISQLNSFYRSNPCLWENDHKNESFQWIDASDNEQSVISFMRYDSEKNDQLLCIGNFTPIPRENYTIGVPQQGNWQLKLNTDSAEFGGSDFLKQVDFEAFDSNNHGHQQAISINLPPLSVLYLKLED